MPFTADPMSRVNDICVIHNVARFEKLSHGPITR